MKYWKRIPVRLRAALSALALVLALLILWGFLGWAVPFPRLAMRLAERAHVFGPGEIVADETFALREAGPSEGSSGRWLVARRGDRFAVAVLKPKLLFLWTCEEGAWLLAPTEEHPLQCAVLATGTLRGDPGESGEARVGGLEDILAVCTNDPRIVSVELVAGPTERALRDAPEETGPIVVPCTPVGEQVWVGQAVIPWSGCTISFRGYGGDGTLLYDSGAE